MSFPFWVVVRETNLSDSESRPAGVGNALGSTQHAVNPADTSPVIEIDGGADRHATSNLGRSQ